MKKPKPAAAPPKRDPEIRLGAGVKRVEVSRADGWQNFLTGVGTLERDKARHNKIHVDHRAHDRVTQERTWEADDMAARIVEIWPDEMMRGGFEVKIDDDASDTDSGNEAEDKARTDAFPVAGAALAGPPAPPEKPPGVIEPTDNEDARAVKARFEELGGPAALQKALEYQRAYGGGAIVLGIQDGRMPTEPVDWANIKSLGFLNVHAAWEIVAVRYYADPLAPKFGEPEIYRFQLDIQDPIDSAMTAAPPVPIKTNGKIIEIHETRVVAFCGPTVSKRQRIRLHGWGQSVFVRCLEAIENFGMSHAAVATLLTDFAQAVIKIKGLAELIAGNDDETLIKRFRLFDMGRSVARAMILDSEEDFERKATPMAGLPEILDRVGERLAAAADLPVTRLFGKSPSGLGSNGESELKTFYDRVDAKRVKELKPRLEYILRVIMSAADGPMGGTEPEDWCVIFGALYQETPLEQSQIHWNQAQADDKYIANGTLTAEEVAASRFGGTEYSLETTIDVEARKKLAVQYESDLADHQESAQASADQNAADNEHAKGLAEQETAAKLAVAKRKPPARG